MAAKDTLNISSDDGQVVVSIGTGKSGKTVTLDRDGAVKATKDLARAVQETS